MKVANSVRNKIDKFPEEWKTKNYQYSPIQTNFDKKPTEKRYSNFRRWSDRQFDEQSKIGIFPLPFSFLSNQKNSSQPVNQLLYVWD